MKKHMIRFCNCCGKKYIADTHELKRGRGLFCSRSCAAKHGNDLKDSGNSKSAASRTARKLWVKRHGKLPVCRICGSPADIHHKDGDKFNNEPSNHDSLCRSHHIALENSINPKRNMQ